MKSDKELYKLFKAVTDYFFALIEKKTKTSYSMESVTLKEFSRSMDGLMTPEDKKKPHYVIEFQNRWEKESYAKLFLAMSSLNKENPNNIYHGILVFGTKYYDPKTKPWFEWANLTEGFQVFYLDKLLEDFFTKKPDHPLNAVFRPFMEKNDRLWRQSGQKS